MAVFEAEIFEENKNNLWGDLGTKCFYLVSSCLSKNTVPNSYFAGIIHSSRIGPLLYMPIQGQPYGYPYLSVSVMCSVINGSWFLLGWNIFEVHLNHIVLYDQLFFSF